MEMKKYTDIKCDIGHKSLKIMKIKLDLYRFLVVYLGIRNER